MTERLLVFVALIGSFGCMSTATAVRPAEATTTPTARDVSAENFDAHTHSQIGPNQGSIRVEHRIAMHCGDLAASHFAYGSAKVSEAVPQLDTLARCLNTGAFEHKNIKLVGHTDPRGAADYNLQLGRERAQSVATYLVDKGGVNKGRLVVDSEGEKDATPEPEGWAGDRVVDIRLAD